MNEYTEAPVGDTVDGLVITDVKHYVIDDEGNRIEVASDSDGEASREETAFIAERHADHVTPTIH